ncbi:MAG: hypothetical protein AAB834_02985 [Patescibacteria group bacterium]
MGRLKGSKNKNSAAVPMYTALSTKDRITLLANLIVDQIYEDQANGAKLLEKIGGAHDARPDATT